MRAVFAVPGRKRKRAGLLGLALVALYGCDISRPKGAFSPVEETFDESRGDFSADAGVMLGDGGPVDGLPANRDGLLMSGRDGDGEDLDPSQRALFALTGRYVLRADMFSIVAAQQLFAKLEVHNTTSHFSVAEIKLDPKRNQLVMTERLCYQRYAHTCVAGCSKWTTEVDARATRFFPYVERDLTITGGRFVGEAAVAALGFSGKGSDLPQKQSDSRVWDLDDDVAVREGLLTRIHATGTPVGDVTCDVYQVQSFHSSFEGELGESGLDHASATLDTQGTSAKRLGAAGPNAQTCKTDSGGVKPGVDVNTLRLSRIAYKRFDDVEFWSCPSLEQLEDELPKPE